MDNKFSKGDIVEIKRMGVWGVVVGVPHNSVTGLNRSEWYAYYTIELTKGLCGLNVLGLSWFIASEQELR